MCRSKRCCVSFVLALLLSSVSLVPCFASGDITGEDFTVNTDNTLCTVRLWAYIIGDFGDFSAPSNTLQIFDTGLDTNGVSFPIAPQMHNLSSFILQEDVTLYWRIAPFLVDADGISNNKTEVDSSLRTLPTFWYGSGNGDKGETEVFESTVQRLALGVSNYGRNLCRSYRATLPANLPNGAYTENFSIYYPDETNPLWKTKTSSGESLMFTVDMFQVVHTTEGAILNVLDNILAECEEMNVNLNNILSALDNILVQLRALNADTDTIISMLNTLTGLSQSQLTQLENISSSVDAIYYFLTQALKTESDELSGEAATIGGAIENNQYAEDYYQTSMQGSYDSLDLDNFSFGGIAVSMELVGTVFSDMWAAFGEYTILFTYPMILGIALLVIGRISKHGGGNSSRNSEHKGGEGGA